jgi:hypothetical protein
MAAIALVGAIGLSLGAPTAAHASKSGKRNTALALGAIAAYGLVKKKPAIAGIAGAGAVYSWLQSNKEDDNDDRRRRNRRRNRGYQGGYNDGYRTRRSYAPTYYNNSSPYRTRRSYAPTYYNSSPYRSSSNCSPRQYSSYQSSGYGYSKHGGGHPGRGRGHAYGRHKR